MKKFLIESIISSKNPVFDGDKRIQLVEYKTNTDCIKAIRKKLYDNDGYLPEYEYHVYIYESNKTGYFSLISIQGHLAVLGNI